MVPAPWTSCELPSRQYKDPTKDKEKRNAAVAVAGSHHADPEIQRAVWATMFGGGMKRVYGPEWVGARGRGRCMGLAWLAEQGCTCLTSYLAQPVTSVTP